MAAPALPALGVADRWMTVPPTSTGLLHIGDAAAAWVRGEPCSGGMGLSGGWPTRCGVIALPLWREVDTAELSARSVCAECCPGTTNTG